MCAVKININIFENIHRNYIRSEEVYTLVKHNSVVNLWKYNIFQNINLYIFLYVTHKHSDTQTHIISTFHRTPYLTWLLKKQVSFSLHACIYDTTRHTHTDMPPPQQQQPRQLIMFVRAQYIFLWHHRSSSIQLRLYNILYSF